MQESRNPELIIVLGASAGGLNAITELVGQFKKEWNAAVFIVIHLSKVGLGQFLIHRLQKYTNFSCSMARHGEKIEAGNIYLPSPDQHLLMKDGEIVLGEGPTENRWRPSIDILFRSAAVHYTNRVIGIIMTGFLNDGVSGMSAIKKSGGFAIVQDPEEAEYPDMPLAVLNHMEVDYRVPLSQMGESIQTIIDEEILLQITPPLEVVKESEIAETAIISIDEVQKFGEVEFVACPDCGGTLWTVQGDVVKRYRCHVGHAYTEMDLLLRQSEGLEATLWIALRMMEERRSLFRKIAKAEKTKGLNRISAANFKRAEELEEHINKLKHLLFATRKT
jgi:two-component system chemotaxis response regulator CheB